MDPPQPTARRPSRRPANGFKLLKAGPKDIASYGWEQAQSDFAAGNAVFLLDADHMAEVFGDS